MGLVDPGAGRRGPKAAVVGGACEPAGSAGAGLAVGGSVAAGLVASEAAVFGDEDPAVKIDELNE